ncbi:MAG TPA: hypothetical protein PKH07_12325, partial [bacterium]|nr:hypothetical protein [bacterium]
EPNRISERPRQPESLREVPDSGSRLPNFVPKQVQEPERVAPRAPSVEPRMNPSEPVRFGNEPRTSAPKQPERDSRPVESYNVRPSEPSRAQPNVPSRPDRSVSRPVAPRPEAPSIDIQAPTRQEPPTSVPQSRSVEQPSRSFQPDGRSSSVVQPPSGRTESPEQGRGQFGRSR